VNTNIEQRVITQHVSQAFARTETRLGVAIGQIDRAEQTKILIELLVEMNKYHRTYSECLEKNITVRRAVKPFSWRKIT
jgi:hypothetical protein